MGTSIDDCQSILNALKARHWVMSHGNRDRGKDFGGREILAAERTNKRIQRLLHPSSKNDGVLRIGN